MSSAKSKRNRWFQIVGSLTLFTQGANGDVPVVIPAGPPKSGSCNDIAWTSAYPQITSMLHTYYGDARIVNRHWPSLVRYQENLIDKAKTDPNKLAECDQFKDWLCVSLCGVTLQLCICWHCYSSSVGASGMQGSIPLNLLLFNI